MRVGTAPCRSIPSRLPSGLSGDCSGQRRLPPCLAPGVPSPAPPTGSGRGGTHEAGQKGPGGAGRQDPRPELEVCLLQVVTQDAQVPAVPGEGVASRGPLQDLGHGPQGVPLRRGQHAARSHGHHVEGVGRHHGRVQEAVVQEVAYRLRAEGPFGRPPAGGWPAATPTQLAWPQRTTRACPIISRKSK